MSSKSFINIKKIYLSASSNDDLNDSCFLPSDGEADCIGSLWGNRFSGNGACVAVSGAPFGKLLVALLTSYFRF